MSQTNDRVWKKPQDVKNLPNSTTIEKRHPKEIISPDTWTEFSNHPSWNNLFVILENYINRCTKIKKKSEDKHYDCHSSLKKVSIRKKYKKYKKRYKMIKSENSRTSDSGYECNPRNEKLTIKSGDYK